MTGFKVPGTGFRVLGSGFAALAALALSVSEPLAAQSFNWPLHNLDLAGSRFAALDQINPSNVTSLSPRWLFHTGVIDVVRNQPPPAIVDATIYLTNPPGSVCPL